MVVLRVRDDVIANPTLGGRSEAGMPDSLIDLKHTRGKAMVRDFAMKNGRGWVEYYWYKPGTTPPR